MSRSASGKSTRMSSTVTNPFSRPSSTSFSMAGFSSSACSASSRSTGSSTADFLGERRAALGALAPFVVVLVLSSFRFVILHPRIQRSVYRSNAAPALVFRGAQSLWRPPLGRLRGSRGHLRSLGRERVRRRPQQTEQVFQAEAAGHQHPAVSRYLAVIDGASRIDRTDVHRMA